MAKLDDYKRRQLEISQKLIRGIVLRLFYSPSLFCSSLLCDVLIYLNIVICKLMVLEARGTRLTIGEEQLKRKFELILADLSSPILYRAKIEDFIALSRITGTSFVNFANIM